MMNASLASLLKITFLTGVVFIFFSFSLISVQAQTIPNGLELNGYAWSSNIGWISLNCRTGGINKANICGITNYKVGVNPTNKNLFGYAWSPNIGWIKFDNNTDIPSVSGVSTGSARVTGAYPNLVLEGWARAIIANNNPEAGGWDGWISLRGNTASSTWGVSTENFGEAPQYVWGSEVVGWIDMSSYASFYNPTTLTGTGCRVALGESVCNGSLNWSFAPDVSNPRIMKILPLSPTMISSQQIGTNESVTLGLGTNTFVARSGNNELNINELTLTVICENGLSSVGGVCAVGDITINSLTADPNIVRRGGTTNINWQLSAKPGDDQCTLSGPGLSQGITEQTGSQSVGPLTATAIIKLACGDNKKEITVLVVPAFNEI